MNCPVCGGLVPAGVTSCPSCGSFLNNQMPMQNQMMGMQQGMVDPMQQYAQQPMQQGMVDPMQQYAQQPMQQGMVDPMQQYAQQPMQQGMVDPMQQYAQQPMQQGIPDMTQNQMMGMQNPAVDAMGQPAQDPNAMSQGADQAVQQQADAMGQPVQDPNAVAQDPNGAVPGFQQFDSTATIPPIKARKIVLAIILSIVTCGLYVFYWIVKLTDESNSLAETNKTAGGVLTIILFMLPFYSLYWIYKLGKKLHEGGQKYGIDIKDNSVIYLVLSLFGFAIVAFAMAQSDLNKFATPTQNA